MDLLVETKDMPTLPAPVPDRKREVIDLTNEISRPRRKPRKPKRFIPLPPSQPIDSPLVEIERGKIFNQKSRRMETWKVLVPSKGFNEKGLLVKPSGGILEEQGRLPGINYGLYAARDYKKFEVVAEFCGRYIKGVELATIQSSAVDADGAYSLLADNGEWALDFKPIRESKSVLEMLAERIPLASMANRQDGKNHANTWIHQLHSIDAELYGVKFNEEFFPNGDMDLVKKNRMFLVCLEHVKKGQEFFTSYGLQFAETVSRKRKRG